MTLIKEMSDEGRKEYIFPCDCHDWHYLRVRWDEDPEWRALWVEDSYRPRTIRERLKMIKEIILNRPVCYGEIILNEKTIDSLLEVLNDSGD